MSILLFDSKTQHIPKPRGDHVENERQATWILIWFDIPLTDTSWPAPYANWKDMWLLWVSITCLGQISRSEGQKAATSDLRVLWFALWILTCHFSALFSSTLPAREEQYLGQTIELLTQSNQVNSWDHRPYIGPSRRLWFHRQGKLRHGQALNGHTWTGNQSLSGDRTLGWIPPQLPKWL